VIVRSVGVGRVGVCMMCGCDKGVLINADFFLDSSGYVTIRQDTSGYVFLLEQRQNCHSEVYYESMKREPKIRVYMSVGDELLRQNCESG